MNTFKRLLPTLLLFVFELVIGILLLIDGEKFTQVIFIIFGVCLLISGLVTLIGALLDGRNGGSISVGKLMLAILMLAVGAFFAAASGSVLSILSAVTLVFGIVIAFSGMLKLAEFLSIRKENPVKWFAVIGAVLTIILGIVIAFNPFGATEALWTILGIMIIVSAVFDIIALIFFGQALKNVDVTVIEAKAEDVDE